MRKRNFFGQTNKILWHYLVAVIMGILVGYKTIPIPAVAIGYFALCGLCFWRAIQNNMAGFLTVFPYAIYTEVYLREYAIWVPYLTLQYLLIASFTVFIIRGIGTNKVHFKGRLFLVLFMLLELLNNLYPDKAVIGRALLTQSLTVLLVVLWSSMNVLTPVVISKFLNNIKIAAIYLTGIVLVAHLQGNISYGSVSNSEASNGLAPVQLSGYLGAGCIMLFLSIMNPEELKTRWLNLALLTISATIMVLTFSRGGLYFLASTVGLFLYYNRAKWQNYFKFLLIVPIAFLIYTFVVDQTQGKIVERYNQEGSSNRDVLVSIGFELFLRNPVLGVGTGNYNTRIKSENLFYTESGAHNEFIRAAAEHGIFGIILYWGFFIVLFFDIRKRPQPQQQFAMYFFALFCLITIHNGLKISLQPMLLLLAVSITSVSYQQKRKLVFNKHLPEPSLA